MLIPQREFLNVLCFLIVFAGIFMFVPAYFWRLFKKEKHKRKMYTLLLMEKVWNLHARTMRTNPKYRFYVLLSCETSVGLTMRRLASSTTTR